MDFEELYRYAYVRRPLAEVFSDVSDARDTYLVDWLKDFCDYERTYSDQELLSSFALAPEQIMEWLEEATEFVRSVRRHNFRSNTP